MSSSPSEPVAQTLDFPVTQELPPVGETRFPSVDSVPPVPIQSEPPGEAALECSDPTLVPPTQSPAAAATDDAANTDCPSVILLRRSLDLDDSMTEHERLRISEHVDHCQQGCKEAIDALLRDHTLMLAQGATEVVNKVTAPPSAARNEVEQVVAGYELLCELGRGGMGVVYKAIHRKLKRTVALKMILAGSHAGKEQLARFRLEAEAIARLKHPHIVQIFEIGEDGNKPFFALEFVDGGSLDRYSGTPQPPRQVAEMVAILSRAMHVAHQVGIVHRDLKPANVLLSPKTDAAPAPAGPSADLPLYRFEPKITDFGLAKQLDATEELSHSGAIMGTPSFMAPEQAEGRIHDIGPCTDVYALAAILYDLLTGRPPFKGETVVDTIDQVRTKDPVPPSQLQPKVPRDLEIICLKGLRKDARQRYGSALDLADDLQRFLDGQPILARPVSSWERAWKWARREPAKAAAIAAALLALVAGAVGMGFYGLYKEQQATVREKEATAKAERLEQQQGRRQELDRLRSSAEEAESKGRLPDAERDIVAALAILNNDPDAFGDDLRSRLEASRNQVREKLDVQVKEKDSQAKLLADRKDFAERVARFRPARYEVVFHAISFREENRTDDTTVVRRAAPQALEKLGLDVTKRPEEFAAGLVRFGPFEESPGQLDKLAQDCYQILLAWSAAEAAPGADAVDAEASPRRALQLLDRAGALAQAFPIEKSQVYHLRRAQLHDQLGNQSEGDSERNRAEAIATSGAPTATIDLFESALNHYRKDEIKDAAADCEQVFTKDPEHFWTKYVASLCDLRKKDWGVAIVRLSTCLVMRPESPELLMHRALAHAGAADAKGLEAAQAVARGARAAADSLRQSAADSLRAATTDFDAALRVQTDDALRADVLINRSFVWKQLKRWRDAEDDLNNAIQLQPRAYQGHVSLAQVYQMQAKHAEAVQAMDKAIKLRPNHPNLYAIRAQLQLDRGEAKAARQDFEDFLTRAEKGTQRWAEALVALARLKLKAEELAPALADCDAVVQALPTFAPAHLQRAAVLVRLDRHADAGLALDRYLAAKGPEQPQIYRVRGLIHMRFGKQLEAVEAFTRALALKPDAETYSLRGWANLAQEASRPALADFDAALALDKTHTDALRGRAMSLVLLGRMAEAEDHAEAALKQGPPTPELLFQVACIYGLAVGQRGVEGSALRYHDRALSLLRAAMDKLPNETERRAFWLNKVEKTPALVPIRGTAGMRQLSRLYGSN